MPGIKMKIKMKVRNFVISIFKPKKRKFELCSLRIRFSLTFETRMQTEIFVSF